MRGILQIVAVIIALAATTTTLAAKTKNDSTNSTQGALLHCDSMSYDFGTVERRLEEVKHIFIIENRGDEPLAIVRVERSCSCMKINLSRRPIAAGEKREMKVTYELRKMPPGIFSKVVQIYSNSRDEGFNQFTISGRSVQTPRK